MIPSTDLRIGTYVLCGKTPSVVQEIMASGISFDSLGGDIACSHCEHEDVHPIPLNEEWLTKFGFRLLNTAKWQCAYNDIKRTDKVYCQTIFNTEDVPELEIDVILDFFEYEIRRIGIKGLRGSIKSDDIKYVHEFQSWWYLLTGTELKIKE